MSLLLSLQCRRLFNFFNFNCTTFFLLQTMLTGDDTCWLPSQQSRWVRGQLHVTPSCLLSVTAGTPKHTQTGGSHSHRVLVWIFAADCWATLHHFLTFVLKIDDWSSVFVSCLHQSCSSLILHHTVQHSGTHVHTCPHTCTDTCTHSHKDTHSHSVARHLWLSSDSKAISQSDKTGRLSDSQRARA